MPQSSVAGQFTTFSQSAALMANEENAPTPEELPTPEAKSSTEQSAPAAAEQSAPTAESTPAADSSAASGPISLDRIRALRKSQQKPSEGTTARQAPKAENQVDRKVKVGEESSKRRRPPKPQKQAPAAPKGPAPKVAVPSTRNALPQELEDELAAAFGGEDIDKMLVGDPLSQVGRTLSEGQRVQAKVMKSMNDAVFVSLGGPDEGVIATEQFDVVPEDGTQVEVVVRGYIPDEGMYEVTLPGKSVEVSDWDDIAEGEVIEVLVTGSNTGGLECKVGSIRGFIPASQVAEYRVENLGDMVDQKVLCVVTEANQRRGNLVLSRRAVLEREKAEKRAERLANLEVGAAVEGTVRKITDFGAFVDIGGLDGLLHISQLSWERVKHPSDILEEGQQIQVRVDKIDEKTRKIGLSYRSLQDHPWKDAESSFSVGAVVKGTVTRIAEFGAFVKVATGVEGLVHVSELAHHRVSNVGNVVSEGQEVSVKVLSVDAEQQRMSLSIKGATAAPEPTEQEAAPEEPPAKPVLPKHTGPLKGGVSGPSNGEKFGLKW